MCRRVRPTWSEIMDMDTPLANAVLDALPNQTDGSAEAFVRGLEKGLLR
jgi:hypothetical protein